MAQSVLHLGDEAVVIKNSFSANTAINDAIGRDVTVTEITVTTGATAGYVLLYDAKTVTPGTSDADFVFLVPANSTDTFPIDPGAGQKFSNGLCFVASDAGDGSSSPTNAISVAVNGKLE